VTEYFGEKSHQVEPSVLTAFGIEISSRYGRAEEIRELLRFADLAAQSKVSHYVKRAFYDSKAPMCSLELDPGVQEGDAVASLIFEAASASIRLFDWFGLAQHGGELAEELYGGTTV
jgi:hypothetical protein